MKNRALTSPCIFFETIPRFKTLQKINVFLAQSKELREIINVKLCVTLVIGLKVLAKVSEVQVILSLPKTEEASSYKNKESYPATKGDL